MPSQTITFVIFESVKRITTKFTENEKKNSSRKLENE
jgi:hypothetical protein